MRVPTTGAPVRWRTLAVAFAVSLNQVGESNETNNTANFAYDFC